MVTKPLRSEAGTEVPAGSEATAQAGAEVPGDIRTGIEAGDTVRGEAGSEVPVDSRIEVEACDTEAEGGETSGGRPVGVTTASDVSAKASGEAKIIFTEVRADGEAGAEVPDGAEDAAGVETGAKVPACGSFPTVERE